MVNGDIPPSLMVLFSSKGVDQEIFPGRPMGVDSVRAKINHPLMMMMNEFKALAMC